MRDERTARRLGFDVKTVRSGRSREGEVIRSVLRARISGAYDSARGFRARFDGAKLLTLNELLRLNPMARHRYRSAWHRAAHDAALYIAPRARLHGPLAVSILRRGARLVDNDGLAAALKFAIDGFRCCGLIEDDDPSVVAEIRLSQERGAPAVEVAFEPIGR
ncbi:MAG: hypothetical protein DI596_07835 [Azospira oryzae]|nr:MAG: hypothetical protein DI596_07835 [Azospira oryzae]PZP79746.1 MAG: hypothetical protein DI593_07835 [Azospira oryzae]